MNRSSRMRARDVIDALTAEAFKEMGGVARGAGHARA